MTFISYAQNYEDVMLWRALKHIENGFYIDVGANHPEEDSVTKSFYEHGWTGINIEPEKEYYELLNDDRPNDTNLNIAISSCLSSIDFFVSDVRGWSTTDGNGLSNLKNKNAFFDVRNIQAMSLDELFIKHKVKEVHFLKIDVEGAEKDVLESLSFKSIRPWVIVIEATKPTTLIDVSSEWEYILLESAYVFAYFDGINKYYIDNEHLDLLSAFQNPPNVFDEFSLIGNVRAEAKANQAEAKANQAEAKANQAEAKANQAEAKANQAEAKANQAEAKVEELHIALHCLYTSRSWRITKPLRWFMLQLKLLSKHGLFYRSKTLLSRFLKSIVRRGVAFLASHPGLRLRLVALVRKLGFYNVLRLVYLRLSRSSQPRKSVVYEGPGDLQKLTPHARRIYVDLKDAIEKKQSNSN